MYIAVQLGIQYRNQQYVTLYTPWTMHHQSVQPLKWFFDVNQGSLCKIYFDTFCESIKLLHLSNI